MRAALLVALCSPLLGAQAFVPPAGVYSQRELVAQTAVRHTSPGTSSCVAQGHVCSAGCPCARRRRQLLQWAAAGDDEEPATEESEEEVQEGEEEEGEEEEPRELTPEEQERKKLKDEIKELEAKLAIKRNEMVAAQDRLKTVGKDGYLRLAAEVDTYKRRRADSLSFVREEAVKEAMKHMVTALDALEGLGSRFEDVTDEADLKILQGYKGLQSNFVSTVTKLGLVPIAPKVGDKVDEMKHLVEERVVEGDEDNVIVAVLEKGYEIGGRLVRPATVKVAVTEASLKKEEEDRKAAEAAEEGGEGEEGEEQ